MRVFSVITQYIKHIVNKVMTRHHGSLNRSTKATPESIRQMVIERLPNTIPAIALDINVPPMIVYSAIESLIGSTQIIVTATRDKHDIKYVILNPDYVPTPIYSKRHTLIEFNPNTGKRVEHRAINNKAKLTDDVKEAIINDPRGAAEVAHDYGISTTIVYKIRRYLS